MAPVYLNPPLDSDPFLQIVQQKDDQLLQKLLRSSSNPASDSLSCPTFLHSLQEQRMINLFGESQQHGQKVDQCMANGGSSDLQISIQASNSKMNNISNDKLPIRKREIGEGSSKSDDVSSSSAKWMSSKMRLMHKMINSFNNSTTTATDESVKVSQKLQNQMHDNGEVDSFSNSSSSNTIRVCSDCNTTTTPLWRSGPRGPKSLCNACGIRKRKARRAMEAEAAAAAAAAGNGTVAGTSDSTFTKIKLQIKDKKPRISHVGQYKKHCKSPESDHPHRCDQIQRKICFKDFALSLSNSSALKQVLPKDVEEAAILLMELSCGFNHT